MSAPNTIDLDAAVRWGSFVLSGVTGTGASSVNGRYDWDSGSGAFVHESSAANFQEPDDGEWLLENGSDLFEGTGEWPWLVESWTALESMGGTLAFARATPPPATVDLSGGEAVQATLTTALAGANNDLEYTSELPGALGNAIRVRYVNPGVNNASLGVVVSGRDITVNLATGAGGAISSTATQVKEALEASAAASALVLLGIPAGNNGSGVVTAMSYTALAGGAGGLPLPPATVAI
jgi:hypothetical protein